MNNYQDAIVPVCEMCCEKIAFPFPMNLVFSSCLRVAATSLKKISVIPPTNREKILRIKKPDLWCKMLGIQKNLVSCVCPQWAHLSLGGSSGLLCINIGGEVKLQAGPKLKEHFNSC
ncbi:uncharacterized protein AAES06_008533 [Glossophaga mutica]